MANESDSQIICMVQIREQQQECKDTYICYDIKWISSENTATFNSLFHSIVEKNAGYVTSDCNGVTVEVGYKQGKCDPGHFVHAEMNHPVHIVGMQGANFVRFTVFKKEHKLFKSGIIQLPQMPSFSWTPAHASECKQVVSANAYIRSEQTTQPSLYSLTNILPNLPSVFTIITILASFTLNLYWKFGLFSLSLMRQLVVKPVLLQLHYHKDFIKSTLSHCKKYIKVAVFHCLNNYL